MKLVVFGHPKQIAFHILLLLCSVGKLWACFYVCAHSAQITYVFFAQGAETFLPTREKEVFCVLISKVNLHTLLENVTFSSAK